MLHPLHHTLNSTPCSACALAALAHHQGQVHGEAAARTQLQELSCKHDCGLCVLFRDLDVIRVQLLEEVEGPFKQKCDALAAEAGASQAALAQLRTEHEQLLQQHKHLVGVPHMPAAAWQFLSCAGLRSELLLRVTRSAMLHHVAHFVGGHIGYAASTPAAVRPVACCHDRSGPELFYHAHWLCAAHGMCSSAWPHQHLLPGPAGLQQLSRAGRPQSQQHNTAARADAAAGRPARSER